MKNSPSIIKPRITSKSYFWDAVAIVALVLGYFVIGAYFDPFSDSVADWLDAKGW